MALQIRSCYIVLSSAFNFLSSFRVSPVLARLLIIILHVNLENKPYYPLMIVNLFSYAPFHFIHSNVLGPSPVSSRNFVIFVDDNSRYT